MVLKRKKIPEGRTLSAKTNKRWKNSQRTVNEQSAQVVAAVNQLPQTLQNPAKTSDGKFLVNAKGLGKSLLFDNVEQNFLK